MNLPFFYIEEYKQGQTDIVLDEDVSKHVIQVLRMKNGEKLNLTNGKGNLLTAKIIDDHKKHCAVEVIDSRLLARGFRLITIAISLLKNANRFEWFLEKATEIRVNDILPFISERTEKQKFREDRMKNILVSAMLQSQQCWLPVLHQPVDYKNIFGMDEIKNSSQKFIAHCIGEKKRNLADLVNDSLPSQSILIGPEGDFTKQEVDLAMQNHFDAVSLGDTRLRAETAGMVAAVILRLG